MKLVLALIVGVSVLGCGEDGPLVTFERGGGFAPMPQRLVVERDGRAEVNGTRLRIDDLDGLEELIDAAEGADAPGPTGTCADCFVYAVKADGVDVVVDQATLEDADPDLRALVGRLSGLTGQ